MKWKEVIRDYFTFTKNERVGLMVLIALIVLLIIANQIIFYFEKPSEVDIEQFQQFLMKQDEVVAPKSNPQKLFVFNPNEIDSLALDSLAVPLRVKMNLLKYRQSGGVLNSKEDFQKIYGMNDSIYNKIETYIFIEEIENTFEETLPNEIIYKEIEQGTFVPKKVEENNKQLFKKAIIEINSADSTAFKLLYGIGDVLSERIVKYRDLLGGFYSIDQLGEVYGLSQEVIDGIVDQLTVDETRIEKININFAGKDDLAAHPYVSWSDAQKIHDYKDENGFIENLEILQEKSVVDSLVFLKISHYLKTVN